MFWQFDNWAASKIDQVLDDPDVTLERILEEDDVIQQCKAQNDKLITFLTRPETIEQLVKLVITEPDASLPEKIRFKNANRACELLTADVQAINDALTETKLLELLYSFLEKDNDLNPLLASFVSKTWSLLVVKRTEAAFTFLSNKESFVPLIVRHLQVSAISDLLLKMITGIEDSDARDSVLSWLSGKSLIPQLVNLLNSSSIDCQVNAAQVLCDLIKNSREQQSQLQGKATPNPLLDEIESSETVGNILQIMMSSKSGSVIVQGTRILQSLVEYKRHNANINQPPPPPAPAGDDETVTRPDFEGVPQCMNLLQPVFDKPDGNSEVVSALDASRLAKSVCQVHAAVIPRLRELTEILKTPSDHPSIPTTVGLIKPLGSARLEVAHFLRALLSSNNPAINRALADLKTMDVLVTLFLEYPWNSFLHIQVEQIVKLIFDNTRLSSPVTSPEVVNQMTDDASSETPASQPDAGEEKNDVSGREAAKLLAKELILEAKLPIRIATIWNQHQQNSKENPRPGFMGHVVKIANHINDAISSEEEMKGWIQELPSEEKELWDSFVTTSLAEVNTRLSTPLVADAPSLNDENNLQKESILQQGFLEFYMQHMTANLCTEIGFQTAEFTEPDGPSIRSQADQLSKINFDLDGQMTSSCDGNNAFDPNDGEGGRVEHSSDEDDDLFEDESPTHSKPRPMEIDTNEELWNSLPGSSEGKRENPWNTNGPSASSNQDEEWADFEAFRAAPVAPVSTSTNLEVSPSSTNPGSDMSSSSLVDNEKDSQQIDMEIVQKTEEDNSSAVPPDDKMTVNDQGKTGNCPVHEEKKTSESVSLEK